jgi:hypothetical protein
MTDQAAGYDAGDRAHVSERQKKRRLRAEQADADLLWLMNQSEGRRFVWRLLQSCHLYETSFTGTSATFFREGERNVGLQVLADITRLCPDLYARMAGDTQEDN